MKINKNSLVIEEIPINLYYEDGCQNRPVIFFHHGFFSNKEEGNSMGRILASKGYVVICIDAFLHGERLSSRLINVLEEHRLFLMFEILEKTARDVKTILDFFSHDHRVNIQKIGMTGYSMGAFLTYYLMGQLPNIQVAVPVIGIPSFVDFWSDYVSLYPNVEKKEQIQLKDTPLFRHHLFQIDPMNHITDFAPKPLLMMNGKYDEDAPCQYVEAAYELLKPHYKDYPNHLQVKVFECKHEVTTEMFQTLIHFFEMYLK